MVTLTWAPVVGGTGVINTLADLVVEAWRRDRLAEMVAPYRALSPVATLGPVERAGAAARAAAPGMTPAFVACSETGFSSAHHYAVFMRGATPLTSRLLTPAPADAVTGKGTAMRRMPWHATAPFVAQPLQFGDYGGMPLEILWALLDVATILVLGSGL